jgi:2-dehydropantoate 2-reductase
MRLAMIGAGAMGAMFGARFARAGAEVVLYDIDEAHTAAIAARGLRLATPDGEIDVRLPATGTVGEIGSADIAVIMVDSNATRAAAQAAATVLGPGGCALTLQNGIGNIETLAAELGGDRVIAGVTYNSAAKLGPGHVLHSNVDETTIGEIDGRRSERIEAVARLFRRAGLPISISDNVLGHIWMKFVLNAAINPVSAVTGLRPGEIARVPAARRLLERLLDEIMEVIEAKGLILPERDPRAGVLDHAWERYNRPSMLQHLEQGLRTEIDSLNGAVLKEAHDLGLACPFNEAIVLTVKAMTARAMARKAEPVLDEQALEAAARLEPSRTIPSR